MSSSLLIQGGTPPAADGNVISITPERAGWHHVGFQIWHLAAGQRLERSTGDHEAIAVLLGGRCRAWAANQTWHDIGQRRSPFDGAPCALYLPRGTAYAVEALSSGVDLAIGSAPVTQPGEVRTARVIMPSDVRVYQRGSGTMERTIRDILMEDQPADTLLVTEVLTPGGHWSSYPPHKHDTHDPPRETALEELYYHRLRRPEGWAIQRVYSPDRSLDATLTVHDGDCVLVPRGYHPVSAAPGFDLYYLNIMAGPVRQWRVTLDRDVVSAID